MKKAGIAGACPHNQKSYSAPIPKFVRCLSMLRTNLAIIRDTSFNILPV